MKLYINEKMVCKAVEGRLLNMCFYKKRLAFLVLIVLSFLSLNGMLCAQSFSECNFLCNTKKDWNTTDISTIKQTVKEANNEHKMNLRTMLESNLKIKTMFCDFMGKASNQENNLIKNALTQYDISQYDVYNVSFPLKIDIASSKFFSGIVLITDNNGSFEILSGFYLITVGN